MTHDDSPTGPLDDFDEDAPLVDWCRAHRSITDADIPPPWLDDPDFAVYDLPPDRERSSQPPRDAGRCHARVGGPLAAGVAALARREHVPIAVVLLTGWQTLLYRYNGQRPQVVGLCPEPSEDALAHVGEVVVTDLGGERTAQYALTEVGLALACAHRSAQHAEARPPLPFWFRGRARRDDDELDPNALARENRGVPPSLVLGYKRDEDELVMWLDYDPRRFDRAPMESLLSRYVALLGHLTRDPDQLIDALPLSTDEHAAPARTRRRPPPYPAGQTIHGLFARRAAERPHATALVHHGREVSYQTLARMAAATAARLRALGLERGTPVGVCMQRSTEMVAGLLGVLQAGGAYVAFDPDYPSERLRLLREDAGVSLILTDHDLSWAGDEVRCLRPAPAPADTPTPPSPQPALGGDDLAYLCYTSGTTGRPKAAMIPHRGVLRLLFGVDYARLGPDETFLHLAPIAFDASTFELWAPLLHGGRCVLYPPEPPTGAGLARQIRAHGVTTLWLTAALFNAIVDDDPGHLRGLRQLLIGGEALSVAHVRRAQAALPETQIINGYGPTESTTFACCHRVPRPLEERASVPIGRPIGDTRAYILDRHRRPVAPGVPGELYLGGAGLALGYWRRPELTRAAFVPNPFEPGIGARMYKTGDRVRALPDGTIEFLGRDDAQIKLHGFRIELGEVEAALRALSGVRDAVARVGENPRRERVLLAYVVTEPEVIASELGPLLAEELPRHMVPTKLIALDALPRTANGKLDTRALPVPKWADERDRPPHVAPRNPIEARVAEVWRQVLGLDRIGVHDSFLDLGGHSLIAAQAIVRLSEAFGVELPLGLAFESPTVAELASAIEAHQREVGAGSEVALRPMERGDRPPLSFSQERVWFIQQMNRDANAYNFQATLRFTGALDVDVLRRAIDEIIARHESLRTTFEDHQGKPYQVIHPPRPARLRVEDLGHLDEGSRAEAVTAWLRRELDTPFDLTRLPLMRWTLLRLGPEEHLLIQVEHHLVHDGWSFHVFLSELTALYRAFAAGQPSPLAPLPIQFADYACWQRAWMQGERAARSLTHWREALAGAPPVWSLPLDRPRPRKQSMKGAVLRLELAPDLAERARALARREDATLFQVMLAVYLCLVHRYTGQDDLCVGTGVANRNRREIEGLIGMIINTIALRVDAAGAPSFSELVARVKRVTRAGYAHQDVPFDQVVDVLEVQRSLAYSPIYQTTFSFHDAPMPDLALPGVTLDITEGLSNGSAKFDLNVIMMPRAEQDIRRGRGNERRGVTMLWEYSTDILDGETVRRMVRHYEALLAALAERPEQRISAAPLVGEEERRQLLRLQSPPRTPVPTARLVHELVAEHAARTPERVAVREGDRTLDYGALDRRANQLAHHLRARLDEGHRRPLEEPVRVGEDVVAVCMDHCIERVIAQLAVLRAGAAFVLIDPRHPRERQAWMLEDCEADVVLTRSRDRAGVPTGADVIALDPGWEGSLAQPTTALARDTSPRNLAYAIFTSGSTGRPKGVLIEHRSLLNLIDWHRGAFEVTAADTGALLAGPAFDASVWELWPCLAAGATTIVAPPEVRAVPDALRDWLVEHGVTITFAPTPIAERLLALSWPDETRLTRLLTGGDKLDHYPARPVPFTLYNNYGLTENTVVATCGAVPVAPDERRVPSIGRPITNTGVYILDRHLAPAPVGVPGELYIGGEGVARGYAGQPAATAERFLCDPFSPTPGARMYKTGDRGRYLPSGDIEFLGRLDNQVQLRGLRVELGEIDAALVRHPAVVAAATVVHQGPHADPTLVAYLVGDRAPPVTDLREHLARWLPSYMIPTRYVFLDELPLTPNGKLDTARLRPPDDDAAAAGEAPHQPPRNRLEEAVAAVWREILERDPIGVHDDFFRLGGHSLLAAQIIARVNHKLGVDLPIEALFDAPTVESLCGVIERRRAAGPTRSSIQHQASPGELLERLDDLSEEEVAALLREMKDKREQHQQ